MSVRVAGWLSDFLESETVWILLLHLKSVKLPLRAIVLTVCDILPEIKKPVNNKCVLCEILSSACGGDGLIGRKERGSRWEVVEGCREIPEKELKRICEKGLCGSSNAPDSSTTNLLLL